MDSNSINATEWLNAYVARLNSFEQQQYNKANYAEKATLDHAEWVMYDTEDNIDKVKFVATQAMVFATRSEYFAFENLRLNYKILSAVRWILLGVCCLVVLQFYSLIIN